MSKAAPEPYCEFCGQRFEKGEKPHETVERVVKAHNLYAGKKAGQRVLVEKRYLEHGSVQKATISVEAWETAETARSAPPPPSGPTSVDLSRKYQAEEEKKYARERAQREHAAKRAAERAAEDAAEVTGS